MSRKKLSRADYGRRAERLVTAYLRATWRAYRLAARLAALDRARMPAADRDWLGEVQADMEGALWALSHCYSYAESNVPHGLVPRRDRASAGA